MLGIAIGVAVLIVVLSVVNGFETELRSRILSMTSHAAISGYQGGLRDWRAAGRTALEDPRVLAVAPFIEGEGMLVNGDRVSGVAIRGVLPEDELSVSGIGDKMTNGRLTSLVPGGPVAERGRERATHDRPPGSTGLRTPDEAQKALSSKTATFSIDAARSSVP